MKLEDDEREMCTREYERLSAELSANESMGDARVSVYMGVWTAAMGGALVVTEGSAKPFAAMLFPLLVLGVVTLARIVKRNHKTDELIDALTRFRELLLVGSSGLFQRASPWDSGLLKKRRPAFLHLGLLHVLYLANASIAGLAPALLGVPVAFCVGVGAASWLIQVCAVGLASTHAHRKRSERTKEFEAAIAQPRLAPLSQSSVA